MIDTCAQSKDDSHRLAALANAAMFNEEGTANCVAASPHLTHPMVCALYASLVNRAFNTAKKYSSMPRVLDLGAGEGSATLPFLELGAHVTAVDISESQLAVLAQKCGPFAARLRVYREDINQILEDKKEQYDIVVMNSFVHHIPDYLAVFHKSIAILRPHGLIFTFQDPLRYDTLGRGSFCFSMGAYFFWRLFRGNYLQGLRTRIRRLQGIYIPGSKEDDAEYHVTRNGVDQDAIARLFASEGFTCEIVRYFSTQSSIFQRLGSFWGTKNTFAVIAQRA
jgi:2-polyprenyl-6-hydroxyphenyl methylase / 3-demethylubiquinone-9 3-methyltransferase